ncbi:MAG: regulatory iron-sulfur-containing complex subunit RicT [Saprospiraceae bacterium]
MGCSGCSTSNGTPTGCGNKGHCSTGGCNKLNTYDWLTVMDIEDPQLYLFAEVSFKYGARKTFFRMQDHYQFTTGDLVVVDAGNGTWDVGRVSLMGDLVRLQMKKKNFKEDRITGDILRKANHRDIERMLEARKLEHPALVKSRVIARNLNLDMKIGDVEYQADQKKATFFYTADGWVDFRELVKQYAKEFRVKIEMRQIGSRQESARIGGIGSCGRELCCSTWLTDFKTVSTTAARYQNIAINQSKLSGQCGRLKCCLNYELDIYIEELEKYPNDVEVLKSRNGNASLVKVDIFKGVLYYLYKPFKGRSIVMPLSPEEVRRIKAMNDKGEMPDEIIAKEEPQEIKKEEQYFDVTGAIELPMEKKRKKKKKKKSPGQGNQQERAGQNIQHNRPDRPRENRSQENKPQQNRPPVSGEGPKEPNDTKPEPPAEITGDGTSVNSDAGKKKKKRWYNNKK